MIAPLLRLFRRSETSFHELNYLFWECTTRCNLRCRHCGSDCGIPETATGLASLKRGKDMPLGDFLAVLDTIPKEGRPDNFTVVLTGGEPTLRPDLAVCGREIKRRGFAWGMVTNGYFYDAAMQENLLSAGMRTLTISLDGLEESHDWMRGRSGSFSRAVNAVKTAAGAHRLAFDTVTCVNKRNLSELQAIHDLLEEAGVPQWRLFTIIPIGRAASDKDMQLDAAEMKRLMDFIAQCRQKPSRMKTTYSCEGYLGKYERVVRDNPFFCRAGVNIASVLIDGRISACPNIDRDAFSQGNIYSDNFWEVWQSGFEPFRHRVPGGECVKCKKWRECLGGGMHNIAGDTLAPLTCDWKKTL